MRAVVSSGMYESSYPLVRALAERGAAVCVVHYGSRRRDVALSRYVSEAFEVPRPRPAPANITGDDHDPFAVAVLRVCEEWGADLAVPTLDNEVVALSAGRGGFDRAGVLCTVPTLNTITAAMDKFSAPARAREAGMPCPRTALAGRWEDVPAIAAELGYPLLVKRRFSSGSKDVRVVRDRSQLTAAWAELPAPLVLQEYISGDREPSINAITKLDGTPLLSFSLRKRRYLNNSVSTCIEIVDPLPETGAALTYLKAVGAVGFSAIQVRQHPQSGKHYFIESNLRWGANARMLFPLLRQQGCDPIDAFLAAWRGGGPVIPFQPTQGRAVSPLEDALAIQSFARHRSALRQRGVPPGASWRNLFQSYRQTYTRRPSTDAVFNVGRSDMRAVLSIYRRAIRERGRRDLSFLPMGDLLAR